MDGDLGGSEGLAVTTTFGTLDFNDGAWLMSAQPHVEMMAKRVFPGANRSSSGELKLTDTPAMANDIEWFLGRYPLAASAAVKRRLTQQAGQHRRNMAQLTLLDASDYQPPALDLEVQPRQYQIVAAGKHAVGRSLLLGDDVGLGKTCSAICTFTTPGTLPAVVVCMPHLQQQWRAEIRKFLPKIRCHIVKKSSYYPIQFEPDVIILSYHKLDGWAKWLGEYCKSVVFDEVQELRRRGTNKYEAARRLANGMEFRLGLSATPVFNYGDEMYNVLSVLKPGCLGSYAEFCTAWCTAMNNDKNRLKDPRAFGSWLREQHLLLRRTRSDVGRELPAQSRFLQSVPSDPKPLEDAQTAASELANLILEGTREQAFSASGQFDALMRQVTGISKAPHVGAFVRLIVEGGEKVVLFGWHRAVFRLWEEILAPFNPVLYTGTESPTAKQESVERFKSGWSKVLIMSLRSGAGVDGLQHSCRTVVFGEFDWSPAVHEQCIGRVARDGQVDPVFVYYLMAHAGADPFIVETLGLKKEQLAGIRSPETGRDDSDFASPQASEHNIQQLARQFMSSKPRRSAQQISGK